jgi:hypothetical protein
VFCCGALSGNFCHTDAVVVASNPSGEVPFEKSRRGAFAAGEVELRGVKAGVAALVCSGVENLGHVVDGVAP